jgi:transposase-like protein
MTPEVTQAMLKEWYWIVIWGALIAVAFAPTFLKARCPGCKKRNMKTADVDQDVVREIEPDAGGFLTFFRCGSCQAKFKRLRTGPFEDASDPKYERIYARVKQSQG